MESIPLTFSTSDDFTDKLQRQITVRGQYVGFHAYEDAPDEVAFLKNSHRHVFKWEAHIEVYHNDRELEFFIVQSKIENLIVPFATLTGNLGSCETQAERILKGLVNLYGADRWYKVSVSEDGENDGAVIWDPDL